MGSAREAIPTPNPSLTRGNGHPSQEPSTRSRGGSDAQPIRSEDSWIELGSQPSSSSLSSANDEIITTGLRIQRQQHHRRRRGGPPIFVPENVDITYPHQPSSSQDEYEETESESDRVMSSSNEDLSRRSPRDVSFLPGTSSASEATLSSDEEDDNSTALGVTSNPATFVPQPNAFSHPPVSQITPMRSRTAEGGSGHASGRRDSRFEARRNSRSSVHSAHRQRQQQHSPYNMISPSYQADHDAALRASLSTLLSCAAAARGLPKPETQRSSAGAVTAERINSGRPAAEPSAFRLVPESVAMGEGQSEPDGSGGSPRVIPPSSTINTATPPKSQRKASSSKDRSASQPSAKRSRRAGMTSELTSLVSPTFMTWMISAGVVVLFSAISFSAGYILGREVGKMEASQGYYGTGSSAVTDGLSSGLRNGASCGKEAVRGGLRRFRWIGGVPASSISA
ncbi:hypothetical protein VTO42DRAFT_6540 [Malbranchea cinnamomea]